MQTRLTGPAVGAPVEERRRADVRSRHRVPARPERRAVARRDEPADAARPAPLDGRARRRAAHGRRPRRDRAAPRELARRSRRRRRRGRSRSAPTAPAISSARSATPATARSGCASNLIAGRGARRSTSRTRSSGRGSRPSRSTRRSTSRATSPGGQARVKYKANSRRPRASRGQASSSCRSRRATTLTSQLAPLVERTLPVLLPPHLAPSHQNRTTRIVAPPGFALGRAASRRRRERRRRSAARTSRSRKDPKDARALLIKQERGVRSAPDSGRQVRRVARVHHAGRRADAQGSPPRPRR